MLIWEEGTATMKPTQSSFISLGTYLEATEKPRGNSSAIYRVSIGKEGFVNPTKRRENNGGN